MKVVCVNSTLPVRRAMRRDGRISPLHYWGYEPGADDVLLAHRINRVEIRLRWLLGGLDPVVLARTVWHLARGADALFLATQPDLWQALPWLRRCFPQTRIVCWVWMDWEVDRYLARLRACDHVLCATPEAKRRLDAAGLADRATYVIWSCAAGHYALPAAVNPDHDALVAGLTNRDRTMIDHALARGRYRVLLTTETARGFPSRPATTSVMKIDTEHAMATAYGRCRVTWIPLRADEPYMSGLTNLIESLYCGTPVVLGDTSRMPADYRTLPGVFLYRTGDAADFVRATDAAIAFGEEPGARARVATAAATRLDGAALFATVRRLLGCSCAS
jgi:glycosyltransferase involved in cell wall biosynthesis